ncbi:MAG: hypothetical protein WD844_17590 [Thermoleophilaceae bacterium]
MASSGKRKTTMAKLNREAKLRERRQEKQFKKNARKRAAAEEREGRPGESSATATGESDPDEVRDSADLPLDAQASHSP